MLTILQAKARGVIDGLRQPYDLTTGLTWPDDGDANEAYDRGVNVGQALARARLRIGDTFTVLRLGGRVEPAGGTVTFDVIMADPPWPYDSPRALVGNGGRGSDSGRAAAIIQADVGQHHDVMTVEQIRALSVAGRRPGGHLLPQAQRARPGRAGHRPQHPPRHLPAAHVPRVPGRELGDRASLGDMHRSHDGEKLVEVSDGWHGYLDEGHEWRKC